MPGWPRTERERIAAKQVLAELTVAEIGANPLIDPDSDEVSRLIVESLNQEALTSLKSWTVGEFREWILDDATTGSMLTAVAAGVTPELAAAVAKLMSNKDLVLAASKIRVVTRCRNTMGQRGAGHPDPAEPSPRRPGRYPALSRRRPALRLR